MNAVTKICGALLLLLFAPFVHATALTLTASTLTMEAAVATNPVGTVSSNVLTLTGSTSGAIAAGQSVTGGTLPAATYVLSGSGLIWTLANRAGTSIPNNSTGSTPYYFGAQPVPPLVWVQNTYPTGCTGAPTLSTTATSGSAIGTYPITISAGTFACPGYTITYVAGTMNVIAADGKGAQINNAIAYPPGFVSGNGSDPLLNVTSNSICNLVGDGVTDNTTCLNSLIPYYRLYFPAGTYLVSGQLLFNIAYWGWYGVGPQRSIIRLAPNSAFFNTGTNKEWFAPVSQGSNANFNEFVFGIGFDVGYGNPNAIPVSLEMNNVGALRDVIIWSEDGNCPVGLNFSQGFPGPAFAKNLAIYGCAQAINSIQVEYSWTFDQLTTEGQTGTAIAGGPLHLSIQHLLSDGSMSSAPALTTLQYGTVALLDSSLLNGSNSQAGIANARGASVFVRNTTVTGYSPSEADTGTGTTVNYTGNLTQNWTGTAASIFNANLTPTSLYLPEAETPAPTDDPTPSDWTQLSSDTSTWCTSITGSASATVYASPGGYSGATTTYSCTIPASVNHLQFYAGVFTTSQLTKFNFTVADNGTTPLVIDGCPYSVCTITHATNATRTVVVKDSFLNSYAASPGAGNVFFEDTALDSGSLVSFQTNFYAGQSIWARQLDIESHGGPHFICTGCTFWDLGYKTEDNPDVTPPVSANSGASVEIFGAFHYPLVTSAGGTAPYNTTNSRLFVAPAFSFDNTSFESWQDWVTEQKGLGVASLLNPVYPTGCNCILNMYYSLTNSASAYAGVTMQ